MSKPNAQNKRPDPAAAFAQAEQRYQEALAPLRERPHISDAQFPAFMDGIRQQLPGQRRPFGGRWALVSVAAAALVVAVSVFAVLNSAQPQDVRATVVEEATTEIEGARVVWYPNEDGGATVWIEPAEGDVW